VTQLIVTKFGEKEAQGLRKEPLVFGGNRDHDSHIRVRFRALGLQLGGVSPYSAWEYFCYPEFV